MVRNGTDRDRPTWLRMAMDVAIAPVDLTMDFLVRPLLAIPTGSALFPSSASPTGRKPSWRPYGKEPFWYPRSRRADLIEDRINGRYREMRDRALAEAPIANLVERKRRSDAIERRRQMDIEAHRKGRGPASGAIAGQDRSAEAAARKALAIGTAVHGFALAAPHARAEILAGLPPHVADWLRSLPEAALWEMKLVGPTACGRMALGDAGILPGVPRCIPPQENTARSPDSVYFDEGGFRHASRIMAEGNGKGAPYGEMPLVLVNGTGGAEHITAEQVRAFLKVGAPTVQEFLDHHAMHGTRASAGTLAGLTPDQVRVLRENHPVTLEKFLDLAGSGQGRTLGQFLGPDALQGCVDAANARSRVASPVAGGLGLLAGITPFMVGAILRTSSETIEGFLRAQSERTSGSSPGLLAGLTAEQVKIVMALPLRLVEDFCRVPEGDKRGNLGTFMPPPVMAAAVERASREDRFRVSPDPSVAGQPKSDASTKAGGVAETASAPDDRTPRSERMSEDGAGPRVSAPEGRAEPRRSAIPGMPLGTDVELEIALGEVDDLFDIARGRLPKMDAEGMGRFEARLAERREEAVMRTALGRLEFPGLPGGFGMAEAWAGKYGGATDIDFVSGVPPIGDAVQRYAAATPEERAAFRGMPPTIRQWLDSMPEEKIRRLATAEVFDCQRAALGVVGAVPGLEACPIPPPKSADRPLSREASSPVVHKLGDEPFADGRKTMTMTSSGEVSSGFVREMRATVPGIGNAGLSSGGLADRLRSLRATEEPRDPALDEPDTVPNGAADVTAKADAGKLRRPLSELIKEVQASKASDPEIEGTEPASPDMMEAPGQEVDPNPTDPAEEKASEEVGEGISVHGLAVEAKPKTGGSLSDRIRKAKAMRENAEPDYPEPGVPEAAGTGAAMSALEAEVAGIIAGKLKASPTPAEGATIRMSLAEKIKAAKQSASLEERDPAIDEHHPGDEQEEGPTMRFG